MAVASFSVCASERSRWNGVGSTLSMGSPASTCQLPPNGSLYVPSTEPPSSSIDSASRSSLAGGDADASRVAARPRDLGGAGSFFFGICAYSRRMSSAAAAFSRYWSTASAVTVP
jgi:hypothetical protein